MAENTINSTTQVFLDIHDITNDLIIMKDGTTSLILTVDAMNFGLLAEEEQDAIMYSYAGLLNSLNYSIQILINSTTKDVTSYLKLLESQESSAESEVMRKRIQQYRQFVGNLIHERNVLDKKFYVVIPATALEMGFISAQSVLPGVKQSPIENIEKSIILEKASTLLEPKRDHLLAQFARIGLFSRQLKTQEIIQLFYIKYNPEAAEGQKIDDSSSYVTPMVHADVEGGQAVNIRQKAPEPEIPEPADIQIGEGETTTEEIETQINDSIAPPNVPNNQPTQTTQQTQVFSAAPQQGGSPQTVMTPQPVASPQPVVTPQPTSVPQPVAKPQSESVTQPNQASQSTTSTQSTTTTQPMATPQAPQGAPEQVLNSLQNQIIQQDEDQKIMPPVAEIQ